MIPILRGKVSGGKLKLDNPLGYLVELSKLEGQRIELTIRKERHVRSLSQNRLYWLFLNFIGQELGYEPEELHSTFKAMFLTDRSGKLPIVRSTTRLTTKEFTDYLDSITRKVAEIGIVLPSADGIEL